MQHALRRGTLRDLRHGSRDPEGLQRFLEDVLLHEMLHQWHMEITGERDKAYAGHGPAFSAKANEIGAKLGLPLVRRTSKSRDGAEPSPSHWPHNVRPAKYYRGAYVPPDKVRRTRSKKHSKLASGEVIVHRNVPAVPILLHNVERAATLLRKHFDVEELRRLL